MIQGLTSAEPARRLYDEVFKDNAPHSITSTVASGIQAIVSNIERLLGDLEYLLEDNRVATASFVLATADEELAKMFILIDACRLDPKKHHSTLICVCRCFYNHIFKHAYNDVRRHERIDGMAKALEFWRIGVRRWWPESSDPEYAEPPMPHDTFFDREMPLYVDWDYVTKQWIVPDDGMNIYKFNTKHWPSHLDKLRGELADAQEAVRSQLLTADVLLVLNDVYSGTYVTEKTTTSQIQRMEELVTRRLVADHHVSEESVRRSPLLEWPLYHFATLGSDAV